MGNGNERSIQALPASRRAAKPAGTFEGLQRLAQTLVLDPQRFTQLRPRQDRTVGQKVQHTLLEAALLSVLDLRDHLQVGRLSMVATSSR